MSDERFSFEKSDRDLERRSQALNWAIFGALAIAGVVASAFLIVGVVMHPPDSPAGSKGFGEALGHAVQTGLLMYGLPQGGVLGTLVFLGVFKKPAVRMLSASGQRGWMILCGVLMVLAIVAREVIGEIVPARIALQHVTLAVPCGYWAHWQMLRMEDPELPVVPRFTMSTLLVLMFSMAAAGAAFVGRG